MQKEKLDKQTKDSINYFQKSDVLKYVGGGVLIAGLVSLWIGFGYLGFILAFIGIPTGLVLFFIGSANKITDADKAPVNDAIAKLKETVNGGDVEAIKADTEALQKAFYPIAEKIYKEQAASGQADGGAEAGGDGNVYGADFEDKT